MAKRKIETGLGRGLDALFGGVAASALCHLIGWGVASRSRALQPRAAV